MVCLLQFLPGIFPSSFLCVDAYFYLAHLGLQFASRHHRTPIEPPPSLSLCTPRYDFAVMDVGLRGGERGSQLCTIVRLVVVGIPDPDTFMHPEKQFPVSCTIKRNTIGTINTWETFNTIIFLQLNKKRELVNLRTLNNF